MNLIWYLNRLKKMGISEILTRFVEYIHINLSRFKYRDPANCQYNRFATKNTHLMLSALPGFPVADDWNHYQIYNHKFDLTKSLNWHFSDKIGNTKWPDFYYAGIDYRPGNPYGDVRINWELNRLQFLPAIAISDENLAKRILKDWLEKNPYLHGPAYLVSMEVALRWFSIYWALCLFKQPLDASLQISLAGLAVASAAFIENHLSTHSSAGNHLIVEAVGLFWLGKALEQAPKKAQWISKARKILWEQIIRQINPDGSHKEQSFWYLGLVIDAIFHYILLEERTKIPTEVWLRVEKALEFIDDLTLPDGSFPDFGDRDDGFVFRIHGNYDESPFIGLLNLGSFFFNRSEWKRHSSSADARLFFWTGKSLQNTIGRGAADTLTVFQEQRLLKTYKEGGMTLMHWGKGRLLFRHSHLGLGNTYGHGHADALSILFSWGNVPVLIDLGSGQYNGDQAIRNFFRSTIAHNTLEIGVKSQAKMLGPFMWKKSYETRLIKAGEDPILHTEANHDGYMKEFSVLHTRRIEWPSSRQIEILDSFKGGEGVPLRGAFHLGKCKAVKRKGQIIEVDFVDFLFSLFFPSEFSIEIYHGSESPFMGWRSTIYGEWEPIHSIIFSAVLQKDFQYRVILEIGK